MNTWYDTIPGHIILTAQQPVLELPLSLSVDKGAILLLFERLVCRDLGSNPWLPLPVADTLPIALPGIHSVILPVSPEFTNTVCANGQHTITCGSNTVIAITGMTYGYKGASLGCKNATGSCCTYNSTTDCLESAQNDTTAIEAFLGRSDGIVSIADAVASTTCSSGYETVSTFNTINYQCIPQSRIFEICLPSSYRSGDGLPVYIWNRDYKSGTSILATDTSCSVSVEVLSRSTNTELYTLHMQLSDPSTSCQQSITVSNGSNIVKTFDCNPAPFNQIQSETIQGNYFLFNLTNTKKTTGGKFWIGLEGGSESLPILLSSPAVHRIDCGPLSKPISGDVYLEDTFYGSKASYVCDPGYVVLSGNAFRTCQENQTWSGNAVVCIYECGHLTDPENGFVSYTGTYPGHTATYGCDPDYVMDSGNLHRSCIDGSGWNGTAIKCLYDCSDLTHPLNGSVSYPATTAGSQARYICNGNLVLNGPAIRTCVSDSGWDGSEPACSVKTSEGFDIKTLIIVVSVVGAFLIVIVFVGVVMNKCRLIGKIRRYIVTVTASENTFSRCCQCAKGEATTRHIYKHESNKSGKTETMTIYENNSQQPKEKQKINTVNYVNIVPYSNQSDFSAIPIDDGEEVPGTEEETKMTKVGAKYVLR